MASSLRIHVPTERATAPYRGKDQASEDDFWRSTSDEQSQGQMFSSAPASRAPASRLQRAALACPAALSCSRAPQSWAVRKIGFDPGIGILHADVAGPQSFACDLMEAVRPNVDTHVLEVLGGQLRKRAGLVASVPSPKTYTPLPVGMTIHTELLSPAVATALCGV